MSAFYLSAMSKASKIKTFDPNTPGDPAAQIYGLPFTCEEADIVLVPVPWEVTTSYGGGTSRGPAAIRAASFQVDLFHPEFPDLWKRGVAMDAIPEALLEQSDELKKRARLVMDDLVGGLPEKKHGKALAARELINAECAVMNAWVRKRCQYWMDRGKLVGLVGGDHSTPLGFLRAQGRAHRKFGILHIDAHMDLRIAYEGFDFSHASILYNALSVRQVERIVSVGIRDFCEQESAVFGNHYGEMRATRSADLRALQYEGMPWKEQCAAIIAALPQKVHISFDIDGLDPTLCPHTGTPVPGGLQYEEATYLLSQVAKQRTIIGFDLVEVAPGGDEWDANVGARLLWHLCGVLANSKP